MPEITTCLWFGTDAESAVRFYVALLPNSAIGHIQRSPAAWPGGVAGDVILISFVLGGQSFQALNGGARVDYGTAASISVNCADQAEVDRLWDKRPVGRFLFFSEEKNQKTFTSKRRFADPGLGRQATRRRQPCSMRRPVLQARSGSSSELACRQHLACPRLQDKPPG